MTRAPAHALRPGPPVRRAGHPFGSVRLEEADRGVTFLGPGHPQFVAPTPNPLASLPALTPAPALLRSLADVGEVDLAKGLGERRLAEVIRHVGPLPEPRRFPWERLALLVAAAAILLLLALR